AQQTMTERPDKVLATLEMPEGSLILFEGMLEDTYCHTLLSLIERAESIQTEHGKIEPLQTPAYAITRSQVGDDRTLNRFPMDQSNTSVLFGNQWILKLYRRFDDGENPDFEMERYLTEHTHFDRAPKTLGGITYERPGQPVSTLAMLQQQIHNQGDG